MHSIPGRRLIMGLFLIFLLLPIYWLLISAGAYKALFQFILRPFHWEKTIHGLSQLTETHLMKAREKTEHGPIP